MHFFGFDIGRAKTAAEPTPKIKKGLEIGDSGTPILSGFIRDEYNPKLADTNGIKVYDEMRRSDGTVRAAVSVCSLPIRSATWYVEPASEAQADKDIADFVWKCFTEYQSLTWNDTLRHALLSLPFGVMAFEKVFAVREIDGKTRIVWDKLAPRVPRSILKWAIGDGSIPGITQRRSDGQTAEIPMDKLVVIVNEKEGDNWWGSSILRPAYKHWFMKNTMYKIDAIAAERQGLGVPYAKLPENYTEADRAKAEEILKNLRANERAFIIEPADYEIGFKDMQAKTTRDLTSSIEHHNREIMKSVLAQFLELGSTDKSGSRALSEDHSELFLQSLITVAQGVADSFNKYAVKQLVDLNFNNVTAYPKLAVTDISQTDVEGVATTYQTLVTTGGMKIGSNDEQYFRETLGLPERDPDDIVEPPAPKIPPADPNADPDDEVEQAQQEASERIHGVKKNFSTPDDSDFKSYRPMTFAEEKVDFNAIQRAMDDLEDRFDTDASTLLHAARDAYLAALTKAAHAGNTQGIKDATLNVQAEYAKIIKNAARAAFQYGKTNAAKEMGVNAPADPADILQQIDIQANAIAEQQIAQITNQSKTAYVEALNKGNSITAALAAADTVAQEAIDTLVSNTTGILLAGYVNHGRNTVHDQNDDKIYALQRSELLDASTCNYCLSVDGRVIEKDDPFGANTIFHSNCRGIWVSILTDEAELPPIDGIPQSIKDRFGGTVNDLIQPKNPSTTANSLARKEVERRIARQKKQ